MKLFPWLSNMRKKILIASMVVAMIAVLAYFTYIVLLIQRVNSGGSFSNVKGYVESFERLPVSSDWFDVRLGAIKLKLPACFSTGVSVGGNRTMMEVPAFMLNGKLLLAQSEDASYSDQVYSNLVASANRIEPSRYPDFYSLFQALIVAEPVQFEDAIFSSLWSILRRSQLLLLRQAIIPYSTHVFVCKSDQLHLYVIKRTDGYQLMAWDLNSRRLIILYMGASLDIELVKKIASTLELVAPNIEFSEERNGLN